MKNIQLSPRDAFALVEHVVHLLRSPSPFVRSALELAYEGRLNSGTFNKKSARNSQVICELERFGLVVWSDNFRYRSINEEMIDFVRYCALVLDIDFGECDATLWKTESVNQLYSVFDLLSTDQCWSILDRGNCEPISRSEFVGAQAKSSPLAYFAKLRKTGLIVRSGTKLYRTNLELLESLSKVAVGVFACIDSAKKAQHFKSIRNRRMLAAEESTRRSLEFDRKIARAQKLSQSGVTCYGLVKKLKISRYHLRKNGIPLVEGRGRCGTSITILKDGVKYPFETITAAAQFIGITQAHLSNVCAGRNKPVGYTILRPDDNMLSAEICTE
jgi:hypothetical protein